MIVFPELCCPTRVSPLHFSSMYCDLRKGWRHRQTWSLTNTQPSVSCMSVGRWLNHSEPISSLIIWHLLHRGFLRKKGQHEHGAQHSVGHTVVSSQTLTGTAPPSVSLLPSVQHPNLSSPHCSLLSIPSTPLKKALSSSVEYWWHFILLFL
jgi:hypothetical protein